MIDWSTPAGIAAFVIGALLFVGEDVFLFRVLHRWYLVLFLLIAEILVLVGSGIPGMAFLAYVAGLLFIVGAVGFLYANASEFRAFLSSAFTGGDFFRRKGKSPEPEALFDREDVYDKVYMAVVDMSKLKRGALITFMKKDDILDDSKVGTIVKQRGVDIHAPVSTELLETIFYEGTRLHDGAVVIKNDEIARAAVFFTSTARPLTGKYGSRHQAAIGISENSDSVTIVVSEETGRISIAFQGELTSVSPDIFRRVFEDDMAYEASPEAAPAAAPEGGKKL